MGKFCGTGQRILTGFVDLGPYNGGQADGPRPGAGEEGPG